MSDSSYAAIVLAAGASTRMGKPKQLMRMGGETLLHRTARMAGEAGCAPILVVLGDREDEMRPEVEGLPATVLVNRNWVEGMASSLRCGMVFVSGLPSGVAGVLVLVCDQPGLSREHLETLIHWHAERGALVTASFYAGRAGVPAVFAPPLFAELLALQGDRGARELIRAHEGQVETVSWPEGAVDLDCPEDLEAIGPQ